MNIAQRNRIIVASILFMLLIAASFIFGPTVFLIGLVAIATSFIIEFLSSVARKEKFDWTTIWFTPLIITLLTTPTIIDQVWMVAVATGFGVFFAKAIWGGEGKYVFQPAMVGLIFIALAFPVYTLNFFDPIAQAATTITPAVTFKSNPGAVFQDFDFVELLMGQYAGGLGTTFKLGILILGGLLMVLRISDWKIPLTFLGSYFVLSLVKYLLTGIAFGDSFLYAGYSIFMGHLLFVAMFVA
ncbi:MAG TPA: RnfABCDGE type electron transport complex subunit D, partial [Acholeplasma sp.]|nr:RnfABCDGE type electron transport complex subunit D [Acholeplasma sp.]